MLHDPLAWSVAALLLYAVSTNLDWAVRPRPRAPGRLDPLLAALDRPDVRTVLRGAYLLGIPAAAVLLRVPRPAHLGLVLPRSPGGAVSLALIAIGVLAAVAAGEWWFARAAGRPTPRGPRRVAVAHAATIALDALLREAHWALFRAGALSIAGAETSVGLGVGLALLSLEAWTNPARRAAFDDPGSVAHLARDAALAVQSMLVFAATGSTLAAYVGHVVVRVAWDALLGARAGGSRDPHPSAEAVSPTVV